MRSRTLGASAACSCATSCASETGKPSVTKVTACFHFAGVIRLAAPSSSSFPHRPQFESISHALTAAALIRLGRIRDAKLEARRVVELDSTFSIQKRCGTDGLVADMKLDYPKNRLSTCRRRTRMPRY
jgi:hypothetical protein